jgi:hypothetical protein
MQGSKSTVLIINSYFPSFKMYDLDSINSHSPYKDSIFISGILSKFTGNS